MLQCNRRKVINVEIVNAMYGYVEVLYRINQTLLKLCGTDVIEEFGFCSKEVLDVIQDIPRIIPYSYNNEKKILEYKNKNGLLEFKNEIEYLEKYYNSILENNYLFLDKVRKIRNKYEHKNARSKA